MAGQAIADGRLVDVPLDLGGVFVAVAGQAKLVRRGRDQHDAGSVFVDANLVTAQTSGGDRGVNGRALGLVGVTLEALGAVNFRIERNGVDGAESPGQADRNQAQDQQDTPDRAGAGEAAGTPKGLFLACELGKDAHPSLLEGRVHEGRRPEAGSENFHRFHK